MPSPSGVRPRTFSRRTGLVLCAMLVAIAVFATVAYFLDGDVVLDGDDVDTLLGALTGALTVLVLALIAGSVLARRQRSIPVPPGPGRGGDAADRARLDELEPLRGDRREDRR